MDLLKLQIITSLGTLDDLTNIAMYNRTGIKEIIKLAIDLFIQDHKYVLHKDMKMGLTCEECIPVLKELVDILEEGRNIN